MKLTKKKGLIAIVLVAAIALMGFGFAAWSSTLNIDGTVTSDASWKIEITKADVKTLTGAKLTDENGTIVGTISEDKHSATLPAVTYTEPTAWVEYEITVENNGTLDAKINKDFFGVQSSDPTNVGVQYVDFNAEELKVGENCTFTVIATVRDVTDDTDTFDIGDVTISVDLRYDQVSAVTSTTAPTHSHTND